MFCGSPQKCVAEKCTGTKLVRHLGACCVGFGGQESCDWSSALSILLNPATTVFHLVPLMSWTGNQPAPTKSCPSCFCPRMQNRSELDRYGLCPRILRRDPHCRMSTEVGSCSFHADSGYQLMCFQFNGFPESIVLERQAQATKHFCPFPDSRTCLTNSLNCLEKCQSYAGEHRRLTCYRRYSKSFRG